MKSPEPPLAPRYDDGLFPVLHVLRCLAGLGIFAAHWGEPYRATMLVQFQLTVDLFFILEGFFAAQYLGFAGRDPARLQSPLVRLGRIYPLYLLGLLLGASGWALDGWRVLPANLLTIVAAGAIFRPTFSALTGGAVFPLNPPSWAIVLEFWAFVALWLLRHQLNVVTIGALWAISVVGMLTLVLHWHDINMGWEGNHYWGGPLRMMVGFCGGLFLASALPFFARLPRLHPLVVIAAAILIHYVRLRFIGLPLLLVALPLIVTAAAIAARPAWFDRVGRAARRYAYGIYLLHYPVMTLCHMAVLTTAIPAVWSGSLLGFIATTAIVISVAGITTVLINDPLQRWCGSRVRPAQSPRVS